MDTRPTNTWGTVTNPKEICAEHLAELKLGRTDIRTNGHLAESTFGRTDIFQ